MFEVCVLDSLQRATQISVRDNAEQVFRFIYHTNCSESALPDARDNFKPSSIEFDCRIMRVGVHQIGDCQRQALA
jgi:hypothetical protein